MSREKPGHVWAEACPSAQRQPLEGCAATMCRRCWACSPPQRDRPVGMGMECWAQEPRFPTGLGCRTCNKILLPVVLAQPSHRAWDTRQLGIPLFPLGGQGMSPETGAVGGTLPAPVRGMEQLPYPSVHPSVHPPAPPLPPPHPSLGAVPSGGAHPPRVCVPRGGRGTHTPVREGAAPPRDRAHPRVRVRGGGGGGGGGSPVPGGGPGRPLRTAPRCPPCFPCSLLCARRRARGGRPAFSSSSSSSRSPPPPRPPFRSAGLARALSTSWRTSGGRNKERPPAPCPAAGDTRVSLRPLPRHGRPPAMCVLYLKRRVISGLAHAHV